MRTGIGGSDLESAVTTGRAPGPVAQSTGSKFFSISSSRGSARSSTARNARFRRRCINEISNLRHPDSIGMVRDAIRCRSSAPRHRAGVPKSSVLTVGIPLVDPAHFLAPRGHAGRPGSRAENGEWDEGASSKCCPRVTVCATPRSRPQGRKTRVAIADGAMRPPASQGMARERVRRDEHRRRSRCPGDHENVMCLPRILKVPTQKPMVPGFLACNGRSESFE